MAGGPLVYSMILDLLIMVMAGWRGLVFCVFAFHIHSGMIELGYSEE